VKGLKVSIIIGSPRDIPRIGPLRELFERAEVDYEIKVLSAHRNTEELLKYLKELPRKEVSMVITCCGLSASLPGVVAGNTNLPVVGIPLEVGTLKGIDALVSTLQTPKGVPVATFPIGENGLINGGLFVLRVLSLLSPRFSKIDHEALIRGQGKKDL